MAEENLSEFLDSAIKILQGIQKKPLDQLPPDEKAKVLKIMIKVMSVMQENPSFAVPEAEKNGLHQTVTGEIFKILVLQLGCSPETLAMIAGFCLGAVYDFSSSLNTVKEETLMEAEQKGRLLWAERSSSA